jgi:O-antigen/teichoic acid export membrane protein
VVARILGAAAFGELGMVQSTVNVFLAYAGLRLGTTATRYVAKSKVADPDRAARVLRLSLFASGALTAAVATAFFVAAPYLANTVLQRPGLVWALRLGSVLLFLYVLAEIRAHALAGFESFRAIAHVSFLRGALTPLFCIPLAAVAGVEGAVAGLALVAAVALLAIVVYLAREIVTAELPWRPSLREAAEERAVLFRFALPGALTGILLSLTMWSGRVVLVRSDWGYSEMGIFAAADQWRILVLFIPAALLRVLLPVLAESHGRGASGDFRNATSLGLRAVAMVALPLSVLLIGLARLVAALYGEQYGATANVIPIVVFSVFVSAFSQTIGQVFEGSGRRWTSLVLHLMWAVVFYLGCLLAIPSLGASGLALAYVVSNLVLLLLQGAYVESTLAPRLVRAEWKLISASLVLLGLAYLAHHTLEMVYLVPAVVVLAAVALVPSISVARSLARAVRD